MTPDQQRLETLATVADIDPKGLKQALKHSFPDWAPIGPEMTVPNSEYTKTREPRWRHVSVLVSKIMNGREVSPESIRSLATLFAVETPTDEFVDSDYAKSMPKADAACLFGLGVKQFSRWIENQTVRIHPGSTTKTVRVHVDDFQKSKRGDVEKKKLRTPEGRQEILNNSQR